MYIYTYIYKDTYTNIYIIYNYIYKDLYKCIHIYKNVYTNVSIHIYIYTNVYIHVHIYKCLYTCIHIQIFIYIYRDLYIHVYIDIFLSQSYTYMVNLVWFNLKRFHLHLVTNQNKKNGTFHIYCPVLSLLQTSQWKLHPYQSISTLPRLEGMHTLTDITGFLFQNINIFPRS